MGWQRPLIDSYLHPGFGNKVPEFPVCAKLDTGHSVVNREVVVSRWDICFNRMSQTTSSAFASGVLVTAKSL